MAHGPILEKVRAAVDCHEGKEVVLEHFLITLSVHCHIWWKKKDPGTGTGTSKGCPNHQAGWMFYHFNRVLIIESVRSSRPPHPVPVALKQRNIDSSLYITLLKSSPVQCPYFFGKSQPFAFICLVRRGLWAAILYHSISFSIRSRPMCRNDLVSTSGTFSSMPPSGCVGIFLNKALQYFESMLGDDTECPEPFFLAGMDHAGRELAFARSCLINKMMVAQAVRDNCHRHSLLSPGYYSCLSFQR
jgi:hypothetical protein